jgi:hypothetical protein
MSFRKEDISELANSELIGGYRIIRIYGPAIPPRIPLVQWVQDLREIARPGACESSQVLFTPMSSSLT